MSKRNYPWILLALYISGLAYLSLYPFSFVSRASAGGIAWHGPALDSDWVDMFVNFVGYLPLGFLAAAAWRRPNGASVLLTLLAGILLSLGFEWAQMYLPMRVSSLRDVVFDAAGTLAGSLAALLLRRFGPDVKIPRPAPFSAFLMLLWTCWQMFPFFPLFKRYKLHELAAQLPLWDFRGMEFADVSAAAFLLYVFTARKGQTRTVTAAMVALVLIAVLAAQSMVVGLTYSNARMAAAAVGLLAALLLGRMKRRAWWLGLTAVLCAWVIFREARPPAAPLDLSGNASIRHWAGAIFLVGSAAALLFRGLVLPSHSRRDLL